MQPHMKKMLIYTDYLLYESGFRNDPSITWEVYGLEFLCVGQLGK